MISGSCSEIPNNCICAGGGMNETLKNTMNFIRFIAKKADIKVHRGFADFLADRIIQAATQQNLIAMAEKLAALLNSEMQAIPDRVTADFLKTANSPDSLAVLNWFREYPRVGAMIAMQKTDELYQECIATLEINAISGDRGTAYPSRAYDIPIRMECISPLAHGSDTKAGNATLFRRMQVLSTTGQTLLLPFYAGNAFRGQMRDLLADHFLKSLGFEPSKTKPPCNLWFFHTLYAGGALEENSAQAKALGEKTGKSGAAKAGGLTEFRDMIPCLSLLGCALGNRVISGRINCGDYRPECREWGNDTDISAGSLFEWIYLTRREDHENHEKGDNSSMIANCEVLKAGTVMHGGIDLSLHMTEIEISCLGMGLKLMQEKGYIGAENRRGTGQVRIAIENMPDSAPYEAYLNEKKKAILTYLMEIKALNDGLFGEADAPCDPYL